MIFITSWLLLLQFYSLNKFSNYDDTKSSHKWHEYFLSNLFFQLDNVLILNFFHPMFSFWTWHSSLVFWEKKNTKYLLFCCCAYFLWEWRRRREVNCKAHEQSLLFHWGCHNKLLHSILRVWTKFIEVSITLHAYTYMSLNFGSYGKEKKYIDHA